MGNYHCHLREITELKYTSLIQIIIKEENFKWHLEAFASELFMSSSQCPQIWGRCAGIVIFSTVNEAISI